MVSGAMMMFQGRCPGALAALGSILTWNSHRRASQVFFVQNRQANFTFQVFVGVISVITGGLVFAILASFSSYSIGLLIGVVAFPWFNDHRFLFQTHAKRTNDIECSLTLSCIRLLSGAPVAR